MKRSILLVMVLLLGSLLPLATQAQVTDAYVNVPLVNMRVAPDANSQLISTLAQGTTMRLIARDGQGLWVQAVLPGGTSGWINAAYLAIFINIYTLPIGIPTDTYYPPTPIPTLIPTPLPTLLSAIVSTGAQNVRSGPGANFSIVGRLVRNDQVSLSGRNADATWVQVTTASGLTGWMSRRYLAPAGGTVLGLPVVSSTGISEGFVQPVPTGGSAAIVNAATLNVRTGPGTQYRTFTRVSQGEGVNLAGRNIRGDWLLIQMVDGRTGWVSGAYLTTSFPTQNLPIKG